MNATPKISLAGKWLPINASASNNGTLADTFSQLLPIPLSGGNGLVITGWGYTGFNTTQSTPSLVTIALLVPNGQGGLSLNTSQYITNPVTNGGGSVIVADFNKDGIPDIFLAAHNESPLIPEPSTAYLSNADGTYSKVLINDAVEAHSATLTYINNVPTVVSATFGMGITVGNPIYQFNNGQFNVFPTTSNSGNATYPGYTFNLPNGNNIDYIGESSALGAFGANGSLEYVSCATTWNSNFTKQLNNQISVLKFSQPNVIDVLNPIQLITPYLSTLPQYQNYPSSLGSGLTQIFRTWSMDLNNDGFLDLLVGESMWDVNSNSYPSALQILINNKNGIFKDQTAVLNPDMSLNVAAFSYNPEFVDIDHSGIATIFSDGLFEAAQRQSNWALLNDGTGRLYIGLHDQFVQWGAQVSNYLQALYPQSQFILGSGGYWAGQGNLSIKFVAIPQGDGSINFLAEAQILQSLPGNINQAVYALVNYQINWNPTTDFTQNITIADRNQSMLMRTWAGNDTFYDANANSSAAHLDGGLGLNTSVYSDRVANYSISSMGDGSFEVNHLVSNIAPNVDDTLVNISRLKFSDSNLALDIDKSQVAGEAYLLYQAAFNRHPDTPGVGYWIAQLDKGANIVTDVAQAFINSTEFKGLYGANPSVASYVDLLYQNVLHRAGEAGGVNYWNNQLNTNTFSRAQVLEYFAASPENVAAVAPDIAHGIQYQQWVG